jgi:hypothetical protein
LVSEADQPLRPRLVLKDRRWQFWHRHLPGFVAQTSHLAYLAPGQVAFAAFPAHRLVGR